MTLPDNYQKKLFPYGNSPLGAEGISFVFEKFYTIGIYPDFSTFGKEKWESMVQQKTNVRERPLPNSVIEF